MHGALNKQKRYCKYRQLKKYEKEQEVLGKKWDQKRSDQETTWELGIQEEKGLLLKIVDEKDQFVEVQTAKQDTTTQYIDDPVELLEKKEVNQMVQELLEKINLSQREKKIVQLLYGFDGEERMSMEKIGKIYGVTRQRISGINEDILKKFRRLRGLEELIDYAENPDKAKRYLYPHR